MLTSMNLTSFLIAIPFLVILAKIPSAIASDSPSWYCKEVSSERKGSQVYSCGVGMGMDENEARTDAFENAKKEFLRVCGLSSDCKDHKISASPERTTCEPSGKKTKCYRLVVFSIGPKGGEPLPALENRKEPAPEVMADSEKPAQTDEIKDTSVKEVFKPFVYSQIKNNPKVYKGMPKAELLRQFGAPNSINEATFSPGVYYFSYQGPMCTIFSCIVTISNDVVERFESFKPIYTDLMR